MYSNIYFYKKYFLSEHHIVHIVFYEVKTFFVTKMRWIKIKQFVFVKSHNQNIWNVLFQKDFYILDIFFDLTNTSRIVLYNMARKIIQYGICKDGTAVFLWNISNKWSTLIADNFFLLKGFIASIMWKYGNK